jgi:hypothetical protein
VGADLRPELADVQPDGRGLNGAGDRPPAWPTYLGVRRIKINQEREDLVLTATGEGRTLADAPKGD